MDDGKVGGVNWAGLAKGLAVGGAMTIGLAAANPSKTEIGETEDRPGISLLHSVSDMVEQDGAARRLGEEMTEGANPVAEPESAEHSDPPEGSTFVSTGSSANTTAPDLQDTQESELAEAAEAESEAAGAESEAAEVESDPVGDLVEASEAMDQLDNDMDMSGDLDGGGPGYA